MELPDEFRDPSEVSRISESVSGREAKTETKKLIRKECYVRREEIQQEEGNTAANINCSYFWFTKMTTKNKPNVPRPSNGCAMGWERGNAVRGQVKCC